MQVSCFWRAVNTGLQLRESSCFSIWTRGTASWSIRFKTIFLLIWNERGCRRRKCSLLVLWQLAELSLQTPTYSDLFLLKLNQAIKYRQICQDMKGNSTANKSEMQESKYKNSTNLTKILPKEDSDRVHIFQLPWLLFLLQLLSPDEKWIRCWHSEAQEISSDKIKRRKYVALAFYCLSLAVIVT